MGARRLVAMMEEFGLESLSALGAHVIERSRAAMLEMMSSPEMQEIGAHRAAGLAGQLNIETAGASGSWLES